MGYRLLVLIAIIVLNGFFAAAEVSLLSVRRSRLRAIAEKGNIAAQAALNLLANPARLLSVTQAGVTLASLGLGWAGEDTLYQIVLAIFHPAITETNARYFHAIAFTVGFLIMTYAHVVFGEVVPKNLAIEKADRLAMLVAPVLTVFSKLSAPFTFVMERSAESVSHLLGLRGSHMSGGHSAEELKLIVSSSRKEGHLHQFEEDAIQALLELGDYSTREIMIPRNAIVSAPIDVTLDEVLRLMREHSFSRLPIWESSPEKIIGFVHYKDLLRIWEERKSAIERRRVVRPFRLQRVLRKPLVVPETKPLNDLIEDFRNAHIHMAMVVDEFGTIVGLITLEDVLDQIFGEIGDEHDVKRPKHRPETPLLEVDGSTSIRDMDSEYNIELSADAGFETLAGFILFHLGHIPREGETVEGGGHRFTVVKMERNRIARVRIEAISPTPIPPASDSD